MSSDLTDFHVFYSTQLKGSVCPSLQISAGSTAAWKTPPNERVFKQRLHAWGCWFLSSRKTTFLSEYKRLRQGFSTYGWQIPAGPWTTLKGLEKGN